MCDFFQGVAYTFFLKTLVSICTEVLLNMTDNLIFSFNWFGFLTRERNIYIYIHIIRMLRAISNKSWRQHPVKE